jgi:methylmalonyl-CoA mutase
MDQKNERLFTEFPPVTREEWDAKIKEDLKGADYEKKLISKTIEGLRIKPCYAGEDMDNLAYLIHFHDSYPLVRGMGTPANNWEIHQDFSVFDVEAARQNAQLAVERGVTSVGFDLTSKEKLYEKDIDTLIEGFDVNRISLNFHNGKNLSDILDGILKALTVRGTQPNVVRGSLGYDPLGELISTGGFFRSEEEDFREAGDLLQAVKNKWPGFRILSVNSHLFSDSGASAVQELAFGLAMMAEYFTKLTNLGHDASELAGHMQWNIGTGSDYFMEIAKIRAARLLFSGLVSAYGITQAKDTHIFIHCMTNNWNMTVYDPNVNMLRLTTGAMSAIIGGCDSLLVKPYDSCFREQSDFSGRIARNIQVILKEESYFDKVIDPAAGSYYVESLTDALVDHAWRLFLDVDDRGGFLKSFLDGYITDELNKIISLRQGMIATRKEVLVGTNHYPDYGEKMLQHIDPHIAFRKIRKNQRQITTPLMPLRASMQFEEIRLAVEKCRDKRPGAFMLTYGNLAMRLARSQFSCNFFACAGYDVTDNLGFPSVKAGVDAALKSGAGIIVICSSDEEYQSIAPEVSKRVNGKAIVVVAGAPACMEELKQKGITEFIHIRSNILETLKHFNDMLGIC